MGVVNQQSWLKARSSCSSEDLFLTNCLTTRAVGLWAADLMGWEGDQATAYAEKLVTDFVKPGPLDIIQKLQADFRARGVKVSDHRINAVMEQHREAAGRRVSLRVWSRKPGDGGWERRRYPRFILPPMVIPPRLKEWLGRHMGTGAQGDVIDAGQPSVRGMFRIAVANLRRMVAPASR